MTVKMRSSGSSINLVLTADERKSGELDALGDLVGILSNDGDTGDTVTLLTRGTFADVACESADVITAGAPLYYNATNRTLTLTSTSNPFVGYALSDAGDGTTLVDVNITN